MIEFSESVVDFMGDVEEGGEGKSLELVWGKFTCPRIEYLEHLLVSHDLCQVDSLLT